MVSKWCEMDFVHPQYGPPVGAVQTEVGVWFHYQTVQLFALVFLRDVLFLRYFPGVV